MTLYSAACMFAMVFALDFVWTGYTKSVAADRALLASCYSALIFLIGGLSTIGYVENPWLLIPAIAGGVSGTYCAMKLVGTKKT